MTRKSSNRSANTPSAKVVAEMLQRDVARQGIGSAIDIPLTALATGNLLLGAPSSIRVAMLDHLAGPGNHDALHGLWKQFVVSYPYLDGHVDALVGWMGKAEPHRVDAAAACFRTLAGIDLLGVIEHPAVAGDLLGPVYSYLRGVASSQRTGAFYTPASLGKVLGMVMEPEAGDSVCEPACGSGGIVIGSVRAMRERGEDPNLCQWVLGDIDPLAVALAGVNMAAHGIFTVTITCGDGLMLSTGLPGDPLRSPASTTHGWSRRAASHESKKEN